MTDAFGWCELMTQDVAGSRDFYTKVVGWTAEAVGDSGYTIFSPPEWGGGVAGMQGTPPGAMPGWIGYIHVDAVDAYVAKVEAAGGRLLNAPTDVPGMLRFAVFADPQGAPFILFTAAPMENGPPPRPAAGTPGHVGWHELVSTDWEAAWDFYSGLFGWTKSTSMDMGPMGIYQMWVSGGEDAGAMMNGPPGAPAPFWNYYFNVDSIGAAIGRATEAGGTVTMGPQEVPGPMWIAQGIDPQGTKFSLVSAKP